MIFQDAAEVAKWAFDEELKAGKTTCSMQIIQGLRQKHCAVAPHDGMSPIDWTGQAAQARRWVETCSEPSNILGLLLWAHVYDLDSLAGELADWLLVELDLSARFRNGLSVACKQYRSRKTSERALRKAMGCSLERSTMMRRQAFDALDLLYRRLLAELEPKTAGLLH